MIVIALLLSLKKAGPQSISSFAFSVYMPWRITIRRCGVTAIPSSLTWIFESFRMFYGSGLFPQETWLSCLSLPFEFGDFIGSIRLFLSMRDFKESSKEMVLLFNLIHTNYILRFYFICDVIEYLLLSFFLLSITSSHNEPNIYIIFNCSDWNLLRKVLLA